MKKRTEFANSELHWRAAVAAPAAVEAVEETK